MQRRDSEDFPGAGLGIFCAIRASGLLLALGILPLLLIGCAAPGEPLERKPPVPAAVSDLAAAQSGNEVVLTFTLPEETVDHRSLKRTPTIEIYRDFAAAAPSAPNAAPAPGTNAAAQNAGPASPTLLMTIPAGIVDRYSEHGRVRYADSLHGEDFRHADGNFAVYIVRTRASEKKDSPNSNTAALRMYPAANPITGVNAQVTHDGVDLTWTPPQNSPVGAAPPIAGYSVYRAEAQPGTAADSENPPLKSPLLKIGDTTTPSYQDTQMEFGNTYVYSVRSVAEYPVEKIESGDSQLAVVVARDVFPPAAPQGLVAVPVASQGGAPAYVELSWRISPETDLAGYNVYRSGQPGVRGEQLNTESLPAPTFRDMSAVPGRQYFYTVTAVDRSGNESAASEPVSGGVPAESAKP